ncbi:MAG TPA: hypothetical protein VMZ53_22105 [Kofleriaceae bacterium]|nr:hypothetical protein [Kofleriaceae bacterium]
MGLAEKRWAADKKKTDEPAFVTQVASTLGFSVPVEIDWDTFSNNLDDTQYLTHDSYGLPNLVKALSTITADDLGKEAIKGALKKIVIRPAPADDTAFTFADGVITWKAYFGSSSSGYIYADAMQKTLEKAL